MWIYCIYCIFGMYTNMIMSHIEKHTSMLTVKISDIDAPLDTCVYKNQSIYT